MSEPDLFIKKMQSLFLCVPQRVTTTVAPKNQ